MADIDKLYEKADKYLQRQKFEAAIETYQEILRYEPNDEEALITLGDLTVKLNRTADALRYQVQLADHYIRRVTSQGYRRLPEGIEAVAAGCRDHDQAGRPAGKKQEEMLRPRGVSRGAGDITADGPNGPRCWMR